MCERVRIDAPRLKRVIKARYSTLTYFYAKLEMPAYLEGVVKQQKNPKDDLLLKDWLELDENGKRVPGAAPDTIERVLLGAAPMRLAILVNLSKLLGVNYGEFIVRGVVPWGIPSREWSSELAPASLLRSDYGIVDWHPGFRDDELLELIRWCDDDRQFSIRLVTGKGGMGKTRLAIELCRRLQKEDDRRAAFLDYAAFKPDDGHWEKLINEGDLVLVFDYAEYNLNVLSWLIPLVMSRAKEKIRVRFLLLARSPGDWWTYLKSSRYVADLFDAGKKGVSSTQLAPMQIEQGNRLRESCWITAFAAFKKALPTKLAIEPAAPGNLESPLYGRVLLLHVSALAAAEGASPQGARALYDYILAREERFWEEHLKARGLNPSTYLKGIKQFMTFVTSNGGADDYDWCMKYISELDIFAGESKNILDALVCLLRECYPGPNSADGLDDGKDEDATEAVAGKWIEPLEPDLLGRYFVERVLKADPAFRAKYAALLRRLSA